MKRKALAALLSVTMMAGILAGCGGSDDQAASGDAGSTAEDSGSGEEAKSDGDITIGSVIMNTSGEWFAEVIKGMEDAGKELGVKVNIVSSDNEVSKESDNVSTFVSQGVDAICIAPLSSDASVAAVENADAASIPVVAWNTTVNTDKVAGFVGVDAQALGGQTGEYAAEYIKKNFPDGCKLALLTNTNYEVGIARCDGFKAAIKDLVDDGTIEIVNEQPAELQDEGLDVTEQMLTANPDIDMIWAWNQTSLLGCVAALQNANKNDVVVMGTDMSVELAKDMQGDTVDLEAITTQQPYEIGYQAIANAVKTVKGEEIEKEMLIPVTTYTKDDQDAITTYIEEHKDLV